MKFLSMVLLLISSQLSFALGNQSYNHKYDPTRDAFADFIAAQADAQAQNKLILLELGGDWCVWCHRLDDFIAKNDEAAKNISDVFIVLKVNVSEENGNKKFLQQFSKIPGYPHFIIANAKGKEIGTENTSKLEEGKSYSLVKINAFLEKWKQQSRD